VGVRETREPEGTVNQPMMSRTTTASVAGRSVAMRRMRRRASTSASRLFCSTNGCTSFLVVDPATNVGTCPICGYTRHVH
jgi:hypothetical protein